MKYLLLITLFFCNIANSSDFGGKEVVEELVKASEYKSILVIGHLYPIYDLNPSYDFHHNSINGEDYIYSENLKVLSEQISKIELVEKVVFLGDTYGDSREGVYELVNSELIAKIKSPVVKILGNHEVFNLDRFIKSGGLQKDFFDIQDFRILSYSPWRMQGCCIARMSVTKDDIRYFNENLDQSKQNIVLVTDMVHHQIANLETWRTDIVPILNKYKVEYVVIGDNDQIHHRYSWVKLDNLKYIHIGMAQRLNFPNISTFLEIQLYDDGSIKFIPHALQLDGLSEQYESNLNGFINRNENKVNDANWVDLYAMSESNSTFYLEVIKPKLLTLLKWLAALRSVDLLIQYYIISLY
jgi:hypothetical protein